MQQALSVVQLEVCLVERQPLQHQPPLHLQLSRGLQQLKLLQLPYLRKLSKPSKVASVLDWKKIHGGTVLSLNIHSDRVGIAVAPHPSFEKPCIELEPLKFTGKYRVSIDSACLERFASIIDDYNVCGVVVSWPLQHDSGRMGAACGRVVYALEQLWDMSNGGKDNILARPFCLWDAGHIVPEQRKDPQKHVDEFGRCPNYSRTTDRDQYFASK